VEDDATARVRSLCNQVAELEQQLQAQREQAGDISLGEVDSLRAELQVRNDQLVDIEHRLAAAEARERDSRGRANDAEAERRQLADRVHELDAQAQELTAQNEVLQALCDTLSQECGSLAAIQQERDDAFGLISALQYELVSTRATAETAFRESQESLAQTRAAESNLRQSMQELRHACDLTLAQERAASARAQARASELEADIEDLQTKVGLAMRDAQRAQERAVSAERTIRVLQTRLTRHEDAARGALQEIPKRQIGNLGSISTALAESEVKVAQQQAEINDLRRQVEQLKLQGPSGPTDKAVQEDVQKLRAALDRVRRERTEDQLRWDKRTRELEEDNRKLRISLSNAEATSARRPGGRRPPTLP
jgi:chromosome segregation ATPase